MKKYKFGKKFIKMIPIYEFFVKSYVKEYYEIKRRVEDRDNISHISDDEFNTDFNHNFDNYLNKCYPNLKFDEQSKIAMYEFETYGVGKGFINENNNAYFLGKKLLNLQVTMWKEDMAKGLFFESELYEDDNYPIEWLNSIFKN